MLRLGIVNLHKFSKSRLILPKILVLLNCLSQEGHNDVWIFRSLSFLAVKKCLNPWTLELHFWRFNRNFARSPRSEKKLAFFFNLLTPTSTPKKSYLPLDVAILSVGLLLFIPLAIKIEVFTICQWVRIRVCSNIWTKILWDLSSGYCKLSRLWKGCNKFVSFNSNSEFRILPCFLGIVKILE